MDLARSPLPGAPNGVVVVAKYSDSTRTGRIVSEYDSEGQAEIVVDADYERLATENPSCIFLQCDKLFQNAKIAFAQAKVNTLPTFHVYSLGNMVGKVEGPQYDQLQGWIARYGTTTSTADAPNFVNNRVEPWGEGGSNSASSKPARTTNSFIPGGDFNMDTGAFDAAGAKADEQFRKIFASEEDD